MERTNSLRFVALGFLCLPLLVLLFLPSPAAFETPLKLVILMAFVSLISAYWTRRAKLAYVGLQVYIWFMGLAFCFVQSSDTGNDWRFRSGLVFGYHLHPVFSWQSLLIPLLLSLLILLFYKPLLAFLSDGMGLQATIRRPLPKDSAGDELLQWDFAAPSRYMRPEMRAKEGEMKRGYGRFRSLTAGGDGESRTTLIARFGVLSPFVDRYSERKEVHFCLRASILKSCCLQVKLYMKL